MKYSAAIALIFGLFAYSQAMPVEEISKEKRFNPVLLGFAKAGFDAIAGLCNTLGNPSGANDIIGRACSCVKAVDQVIGGGGGGGGGVPPLGDESIPEEKRFFGLINIFVPIAQGLVNNFCSNPAQGPHQQLCNCMTGGQAGR